MKKSTPNIDFMMKLVKNFVDKKNSRIDLDCDFNYHLIQRYAKMCCENEPRRKMNYGCKQVLDMLSGNIY
jgi:hypothetical protein